MSDDIELTGIDGSRWAIGGPIEGAPVDGDSVPSILSGCGNYLWPNDLAHDDGLLRKINDDWNPVDHERLWLGTWLMDGPDWRDIAREDGFDTGDTPLE